MLRPAVLTLTFVTGFTGLAYEVTWQKYLAILLGAHSEATASVLGLFLGGLSLGYWIFGALTRRLVERGERRGRPAPLLVVYGGVEAGIGLYCLLFPQVFPAVRRLSALLPGGAGALGFLADLGLAALLILPPAILMGGTIPILTQALARSLRDATRLHAFVYAFNTAGAFAGALASGFVLIEWLGLPGVLRAMGVTNLGVGLVLALLGLRRRAIVALDPGGAAAPSSAVAVACGIVALLIGFAMMVFQTIVIRLGGLAFGPSEYTFSMVVAVFVLCIALGSAAVSLLPRVSRHLLPAALWTLALLVAGLYFALEPGPYWAHLLRSLFRNRAAGFYPYYAAVFALVLFAIGPAVVLSGALLPLLFHALKREVGDLGARAGRLYSLNTVGSLAGALLGGYALLFWLDLHHVYRIAVAALALAAAIVTSAQYPRLRFAGMAGLLLAAIAVGSLPAWRPSYLAAGTFRVREPTPWSYTGPSAMPHHASRFSFYDDDPNSSVAVQDRGDEGASDFSRSLIVNGKSDGNSVGDYNTMAMAALLPALLAERVEHAFVIGFGMGVTAGELASLEEVKSVTVAEISPGVIAAAPQFDFVNRGASKHPKVRIVRSDAYRALLKSGQRYDVIASEPSNPWVTGVEMLFAREFLEEARQRLSPGGVYCQWFHLYETNDEAVALVLRTFASVFDHVAVWSQGGADLLLIGLLEPAPALDLARLEQRMLQPDFKAGFARMRLGGVAPLLAYEALPLDVVNAAQLRGAIHSLYRPRLSYAAGRGFFVGRRGQLPFFGYGEPARVGSAHSLLGRRLARFDGDAARQRVAGRIASQVCAFDMPSCETFLAEWMRGRPDGELPEWVSKLPNADGRLAVARELRPLFGSPDLAGAAQSSPLSPADALRATRHFMTHYGFAAPFDPEALVSLWERCGVDAQTRRWCRTGLQNAKQLREGVRPPALIHWEPALLGAPGGGRRAPEGDPEEASAAARGPETRG